MHKRSREYQYYDVSHPEKRIKTHDVKPAINPRYNLRYRDVKRGRDTDTAKVKEDIVEILDPKPKKQRGKPVQEKIQEKLKKINKIKLPEKRPHICSVHGDVDICAIYECPGDPPLPSENTEPNIEEELSLSFENIQIASYIV